MKLLKLNTDHYIIVDNSEIKEGDCVLSKLNEIVVFGSNYTSSLYKKITHSNIGHLYQDSILPLSLQEVKELIGEVDAEKKAEEVFPIISGAHPNINWDRANLQEGFVTGYNQALENTKRKNIQRRI